MWLWLACGALGFFVVPWSAVEDGFFSFEWRFDFPFGAESASRAAYPAGLTARQVEILRLIASGRTNAQIAEALVLSAYTVKHHVTHILNKTGSENRAAAASFALRHHLV